MRLTDSISPSETAANPASIKSTPSSSRRWAIRSLFSGTSDIPGVCSPSRRVVSKNFICLGKRLNKAIPHLNHISFEGALPEYKIYGFRISAKKKIVAFATLKPRVQIPPFTNASYIITTQFQRGFFPLFSWFVAENVISTFYLYQSGYFTRKIRFVLFVWVWG
jgi:hypothetical protein